MHHTYVVCAGTQWLVPMVLKKVQVSINCTIIVGSTHPQAMLRPGWSGSPVGFACTQDTHGLCSMAAIQVCVPLPGGTQCSTIRSICFTVRV